MNIRLLCAFFLAATCATFGMPSDVALGARPATEARVAEATVQGDACAAILTADLGLPHTTITVAEEVTPPFTPPETFSSRGFTVEDASFCRVAGVASPEAGSEIGFEVWLPPVGDWNGRFQGIGSGGSAGAIRYRQLASAVAGGYAAVATDNGHTSTSGFDGSWSLGHPVRLVDFGYRAQHEATVAGKAVTRAYYGRDADFVYFVGCSQGGHHALMEAQRYPDDYDGIVAGAPANYWIGLMTAELWAGLATTRDPAQDLPREKLPLLGAAVMAACDGLDGLEDGLIDDPRDCDFDPGVLLCAGEDAADCLTAGQVAAARAIYAGPVRASTGESLFPGYALGSEHFEAPDGRGGWARYWSGISEPGGSTAQFMKYSVFEDPDYDLTRFDFDADWDRANNRALGNDETLASALNAIDPDLSAFKAGGGKLISYHGWADALITGHYAVQYYESVLDAMGGLEETTDFYRLFMAPGVAHCRGGPGPDRFDAVTALERWVEQGEAPDRIIASKVVDGEVRRTRPLCVYPQVARYDGSGSIDDAANFACVNPE
ncbi:MAG: tannase/feruloyl esterase family alpha/beta hydrolase [Acidobacteria bacterium]|nr:tannase/feruloyl esterase family alpha/beta hydrolase [Acidobacteriota bacterium]